MGQPNTHTYVHMHACACTHKLHSLHDVYVVHSILLLHPRSTDRQFLRHHQHCLCGEYLKNRRGKERKIAGLAQLLSKLLLEAATNQRLSVCLDLVSRFLFLVSRGREMLLPALLNLN